MPRTAGVFALLAGTKGVTLQTIQSGKYNAFLDDLVNDLNAPRPILAGGTGASTADGAAKELGLVSAKDMAGVNAVGGTANAVTIATDRVYTSLNSTLFLRFIAKADIAAGGMTINLDSIGAKPVKKVVAAGQVDVNAGDIIEGGYYELGYDPNSDNGTDPDGAFILLNPGNASSAYQVGDFLSSARTLNSDWLRRDGALYESADYPELAAILPALPDGVSWSNTNAITSGRVRRVAKTAAGFLMMVDDGGSATNVLTTDNSAAVWSQVATISGFRVYDFTYGGGIFAAIDGFGKVSISNDGVTWSAPATILSFSGGSGIEFAFGLYVAVGDGGKIATSPDGVTWTARTSGVSVTFFRIRLLNGVLVAIGASGTMVTSTDGVNWTARTTGVSAILFDATYNGSLYVVVGGGGIIITSANLTAWTPRTSGTTKDLVGVAYSTSGLLAAGDTGTVRISTDGLTWAASVTGTSVNFVSVSFDPNNAAKYFVGGSGALYVGTRTLPTQFRVPDDNPTYGWIKAVS